jgi:hypothetical protein
MRTSALHAATRTRVMRAHFARTAAALLGIAVTGIALHACSDTSSNTAPAAPSADRSVAPGVHLRYGAPRRVGNGGARTYVVLDEKHNSQPLEIGVALDDRAMDGLPAPMAAMAMASMPKGAAAAGPHDHSGSTIYDLELPERHGTPYRFVELDWNPGGHEPAGVYDVPHFDFHFYTIGREQRDAIDPAILGDSAYLARSGNLPPASEQAPLYVPLGAPGVPLSAVPHMGVHWADLRSQELQGMFGHPEAYRPFTTTFLHGSWDGAFIFDEPMITRAFIMARKGARELAQRDTVMPLQGAAHVRTPGMYPSAYRVTYDAQAKEYHIALTALTRKY